MTDRKYSWEIAGWQSFYFGSVVVAFVAGLLIGGIWA